MALDNATVINIIYRKKLLLIRNSYTRTRRRILLHRSAKYGAWKICPNNLATLWKKLKYQLSFDILMNPLAVTTYPKYF
jgi:hypothetical protein